jgi:deoxycytidine triphosphate deaminase
MLTRDKVEELIRVGEIRIGYSYCLIDGIWKEFETEQFVDPDNPDSPATKTFRQNFFGDRLMLTVGPVVKTHQTRFPRGRAQFKNLRGCFDLRVKSIVLEPHETISVSTNEHFIFRGGIAAFTIPRLRNVDAGILYIPSYIDPHWNGLLQAVIHNLTGRRQELSLCEGVAVCRLYKTDGVVSHADEKRFASKSHHYGKSWPKILREDFDPFPTRKSPLPETRAQRFYEQMRTLWQDHGTVIKAVGLGGSIVAAAYTLGVAWTNLKRDIEDHSKDSIQMLTQLKTGELSVLSDQLKSVSMSVPISGNVSVHFAKDDLQSKQSFHVTHPKLVGSSVWTQIADPAAATMQATGKLELTPGRTDDGEITIELRRSNSGVEQDVQVKWLLLVN